MNQELKKSEELVAQLSKLENGLMQVALASERLHNWKKLISTVDNCLKKLTTALASQPDSSQLAGLARTATRASAAASEMASEISSSDWEQAPTLSATSVADLVEDAWMRVSKGSDVSQIYRPLTIRPNLPKVQVERGLLMLALASLMDNAVRAVKQRDAWVQTGKVHVSAELNPEDRNTLWLSIEDNGPGLPEHVVRMFGKIVEPGTPGGHGNGIALARLSIARSGGVITPFERRTGGTEIRVSLLVAPAAGESNQLDSLQNED